jgi:transcriptional regulator with XRE-family HTH domain
MTTKHQPLRPEPQKQTVKKKMKKYKTVEEMAHDLSDDPNFAQDVERRIKERVLVDFLIMQRAVLGVSQKDVAKKLGCTQSRVSKLENSKDSDIRVEDFRRYVHTLGLGMAIYVYKQDRKLVDELKGHATAIQQLLKKLADLAGDDPAINMGALDVLIDVAKLLANGIKNAGEVLGAFPSQSGKEPIPLIRQFEDCIADANEVVGALR